MTIDQLRQDPDHADVEYPTLTSQQLAIARSTSAARGTRLPQTLSHLGLLADGDIAQSLARATGAPIVPRDGMQPVPTLLERLNPAWLSRYSAVPLGHDGEKLSLALADPTDSDSIAALEFATGATASDLSIATFGDIADVLSGLTAQPNADPLTAFDLPQPNDDLDRISDATSEAPVIRLVHRLLTEIVVNGQRYCYSSDCLIYRMHGILPDPSYTGIDFVRRPWSRVAGGVPAARQRENCSEHASLLDSEQGQLMTSEIANRRDRTGHEWAYFIVHLRRGVTSVTESFSSRSENYILERDYRRYLRLVNRTHGPSQIYLYYLFMLILVHPMNFQAAM